MEVQSAGGSSWIDPRAPERFRGVDVPETGYHPLIEQRDLDRHASAGERRAKARRRERRIVRFRPERERRRRVHRMHVDRRKRARVLEDDPLTIGEHKRGAREAREWVADTVDDPITVQAKMHMKDATVGEVKELVLATALDARHRRALQRAEHPRNDATTERGMKEANRGQRSSFDGATQHAHGALHFRKLRHGTGPARAVDFGDPFPST